MSCFRTSAFTGTLDVNIAKPSGFEWVALINGGVCGHTTAALGSCPNMRATNMLSSIQVNDGIHLLRLRGQNHVGGRHARQSIHDHFGPITVGTGENCSTKLSANARQEHRQLDGVPAGRDVQHPSCAAGANIQSPDIAMSYRSDFNGLVKYSLEKPKGSRWVMVQRSPTCGSAAVKVVFRTSTARAWTDFLGLREPERLGQRSVRYIGLADTNIGTGQSRIR